MSDEFRPIKLSEIKAFFSGLSLKEKIAVSARAIMVFIALFALIVMFVKAEGNARNETELLIGCFTLLGSAFFFRPLFFLLLYFPVFFILMLNVHLRRTYGLFLSDVANQVFAVIGDTNKTEVFEYLAGASFFELIALLLTAPLSVCTLFYTPKFKEIPVKWIRIFCFIIVLSYPFGNLSQLAPVVKTKFSPEQKEILEKAAAFKFNPEKSGNKADTVVILIGESHRQAEFNPAFDKYVSGFQNLYRFSDMTSLFAGTLNGVPTILSRKKATDRFNFFYEKSVFSLFKEAGYETYFVHYTNTAFEQNQLSVIYKEADHFIKYAKKITPVTDESILPVLENLLANRKKKKLIVIKMIGIHINFSERYPDPGFSSFRRFWTSLKPKTKEREMYHYNKAISYSAGVIADIMQKIEQRPEPSLLLFSSDHDICIFDKGTFHIPATCQNAFHIPAMLLLNPALTAATSDDAKKNLACNQDKPLTAEYYFETIASLAGISYSSADKRYDLTRKCDPLHEKKRPVYTAGKDYFYEDL